MSSGSRQTVLSVTVLVAATLFVGWLALAPRGVHATPAVHHLAAPAADVVDAPAPDAHLLRVCADPNNLPFSDRAQRGFENRIADLVAAELHRRVVYYWQPQRRGFIRTTLNAGRCDLVIGIPASSDMLRVTRPYYRSTYVFVSPRRRRPAIASFDDPRLRRLRIGIPITGDDYANPPPAQALAARHIVDNVRGYPVYGDYSRPQPSFGALNALAAGEVDVAIAWGPLAGYFARQARSGVELVPAAADAGVPLAFDIAMGVRRGDRALADALDAVIVRRAAEIRRILTSYGVPLAPVRKGVRG